MSSIIYNQPDADYRAASGFNASRLKTFMRSPAHMKADEAAPKESTPALAQGILFHHLLLTPNDPLRVAIRPEGLDGRTREGKEWLAKASGSPVVTFEQSMACSEMVSAILAHPVASAAFSSGKPEVSVYAEYTDELTPTVQLKGRMDWVRDNPVIVDAKTVEDARRDPFIMSAVSYGWFLQASFYLELWNLACEQCGTPSERKDSFVFVAVEKAPPYGIQVHEVSQKALTNELVIVKRAIRAYGECLRTDQWPCYPLTVNTIEPPAWAHTRALAASENLVEIL